MKVIDSEKLKQLLQLQMYSDQEMAYHPQDVQLEKGFNIGIRQAIELISNLQKNNALDIVRCHECKYSEQFINLADGFIYCDFHETPTRLNDFCSDAIVDDLSLETETSDSNP